MGRMIRESFLKAAETLKQASEYADKDVSELVKHCNRVGIDHSQKDLLKMFQLCLKIVHSVPDEKYYIHQNIVREFANALVELGKKHKRVTHYFDGISFDSRHYAFKKFVQFGDPHLFAISLYANLAARLDDLGLPGEAFNALVKSMDPWVEPYDKYTRRGDLQTKNIDLFDNFIIGLILIGVEGNRETLIGRAAVYFHNLSIVGNVNNDAHDIFLKYSEYAKRGEDAAYVDIKFFSTYLELIMGERQKNQHFDEIVGYLNKQFEIETSKGSNETCFLIASSLAKALQSLEWGREAVSSNPPSSYWAKLLYMKAFIISRSEEPEISNYRTIIESFLLGARDLHSDRMMLDLFKQKNSGLLNMIVSSCLNQRAYQLALELIYAWCVFKPESTSLPSPKRKAIIIALPNFHSDGSHFLIYDKEKILFIGNRSQKRLSDILTLKDKVESTWTAILHEEETLTPKNDTRRYVNLSSEYIEALGDFIGVERLTKVLEEVPEDLNFQYIELAWTNTPVVPLLTEVTKQTYSVVVGDYKLPEPKEIKKVLIWSNPDGSLPMATFEGEAIQSIISNNNIEYELYDGAQCTKSLFLEKYSDPTFDMVWLSSHGEYNPDNPPESKLYVSADESVTTRELQNCIPENNHRRYLILNVCQSGTASIRYDSMGFLGIGPSLTNEFQKVLGHLWYADSLASAVLGIITLNTFLEGNSLTCSLKQASTIMRSGNKKVAEVLVEICDGQQLVDRVKNTITKDLSLPFFSMSAIVFE